MIPATDAPDADGHPPRWLGVGLLIVWIPVVVVALLFLASVLHARIGIALIPSVAPASAGWALTRRRSYPAWQSLLGACVPLLAIQPLLTEVGPWYNDVDGSFAMFVVLLAWLLLGAILSLVSLRYAERRDANLHR